MAKIDTLFMSKTAEKPYPLGPHIPISPILGSTPPPRVCHENGTFRKRCSNRKNLETPGFVLEWTENNSKTTNLLRITMIFPCSNTNPKWPVIGAF